MKQYALFFLGALALTGCDDKTPTPPASQPATVDTGNPVAGVWQQEEQILVLENNGDLYLPNDANRQGLHWDNNDGQFSLQFLDSEAMTVERVSREGLQQGDTLTLNPSPASATQDTDSNTPASEPQFSGTFTRSNAAVAHLSGEIQLPPDSELPDQAFLTVSLLTDSDIVVKRVIPLDAGEPVPPFRLYFPSGALDADSEYQLFAQVLASGGIYYRSEPLTVTYKTNGFDPAVLALSAVMTDSETLAGTLVWQAGRTVFIPCNTDRRLLLTGPQQEAILEDFQDSAEYPHQPRQATISGLVRKVPGQQAGSTEAALSVESYAFEALKSACEQPTAEFANTHWQLTHLGDNAVSTADQERPPHLVFGNDSSVRGLAGCNTLQGQYEQQGDNLALSQLGLTRKACPDMNTESGMMDALKHTRRYRVEGELLTLFDAEDQAVASFQAIYF